MSARFVITSLSVTSLVDWSTTLGLVFGGCCSNALALELMTSRLPYSGKLITFAQFLVISLFGLRRHLTWAPRSSSLTAAVDRIARGIIRLRRKLPPGRVLRVAVDEVTDDIKLLFVEGLEKRLEEKYPVISASTEKFRKYSSFQNGHHSRGVSYDTHDIDSMKATLLDPLSPGGSGEYVLSGISNMTSSSNGPADARVAKDGSILLMHGLYLHTSALHPYWDFSIFLNSPEESTEKELSSPLSPKDLDPVANPILHTEHEHPSVRASLIVNITTSGALVLDSTSPSLFKRLRRLRLKQRSIPIRKWMFQVVLFMLTSLLNNIAFGYRVPMSVHIIFRSGGMVVNMIMGWFIGRRYTTLQMASVALVTVGVIMTTFSASLPGDGFSTASVGNPVKDYMFGIGILTLALIFSGAMGLAQDQLYAEYGRSHWQEALFYLHFLSMPMFTFMASDITAQFNDLNTAAFSDAQSCSKEYPSPGTTSLPFLTPYTIPIWFTILSYYGPLIVNILTQIICASGVHRLTSRVDSLTVALILVIRKAVSLAISILWLRRERGNWWLWIGAGLVFVGTILYSIAGSFERKKRAAVEKKKTL